MDELCGGQNLVGLREKFGTTRMLPKFIMILVDC